MAVRIVPPTTTSTAHVEHPPPTDPTTSTTAATTTVVAKVRPTGDVWWALFGCETGHTYNPAIVSRSGKFMGAFQFDLSTWRSVGGPGLPHEQPYDVQLLYAKRLQAQRGWSPWPTCARKLGLL